MRFCDYADSMTETVLTPHDFEGRTKKAGLSIAELCRRANVAPSSFHRWKSGGNGITIGTYSDLLKVLLAAEIQSESTQPQE